MLEENYVSFEQAKKLKELGFPQEIRENYKISYWLDGREITSLDGGYARSTLSLTQKWLREEKGIDIIVQKLIRTPKIDSFYMAIVILEDITQETFAPYNTYEEALSSGISKALELI